MALSYAVFEFFFPLATGPWWRFILTIHDLVSNNNVLHGKMPPSQSSVSCHNWVTSALGGRAEEVHKQSNYILVDLIVCYSSRPARGCLIKSNETSAPGSFDTALPRQPSLWNELIAGMDVVLIIYKASIRLCSWQDVPWNCSLGTAPAVENIFFKR